jgi:hypothetical protein
VGGDGKDEGCEGQGCDGTLHLFPPNLNE